MAEEFDQLGCNAGVPMSTYENPFASPVAAYEPVQPESVEIAEAELIRKKYIKHEASIRSVGMLYYIGVGLTSLSLFAMLGALLIGEVPQGWLILALCFVYLLLSVGMFIGARGLRRLDGKVRSLVGIIAGLGLLWFPAGTIINGYVLYLLFSAKGKYVFSPEYAEIRRQTPHVKYRISKLVLLLVAVLVVVVVLVVAGLMGT